MEIVDELPQSTKVMHSLNGEVENYNLSILVSEATEVFFQVKTLYAGIKKITYYKLSNVTKIVEILRLYCKLLYLELGIQWNEDEIRLILANARVREELKGFDFDVSDQELSEFLTTRLSYLNQLIRC